MCLGEISKKDKKWRQIAYMFCNDRMLADDLVNEMYLKIHDREYANDCYVYYVIKHLFIDHIKRENRRNEYSIEGIEISVRENSFEIDDREKRILEMFNDLSDKQRDYITEISDGRSYRSIAEEKNECHVNVFREVARAKRKLTG